MQLLRVRKSFCHTYARLLSFEAVAAGTTFRVAIASIAYVNLSQRAIIPCTVVLTFGYSATDTAVYFMSVFIHHNKKPPLKVQAVYANLSKIIDIFKNFL